MDVTDFEGYYIGIALTLIVFLVFALTFYCATRECEQLQPEIASSEAAGCLQSTKRAAGFGNRSKRWKRLSKNAKRPFKNVYKKDADSVHSSTTESEDAKKIAPSNQAIVDQNAQPVVVQSDGPLLTSIETADSWRMVHARRAAADLLESLKEFNDSGSEAVMAERLYNWLLYTVDPKMNFKALRKKCLLTRSILIDAHRVKIEACRTVEENKRQLEKDKQNLVHLLGHAQNECSKVTAQLTHCRSDAESAKLHLKEQIESALSRAQNAEQKQRTMQSEIDQLKRRCFDLEREAEKNMVEKAGLQKNIHTLKKKLASSDSHSKELDETVNSLKKKLQVAESAKTLLIRQLIDLNCFSQSTVAIPELSDWVSIKSGVEILVGLLQQRNKEAMLLRDQVTAAAIALDALTNPSTNGIIENGHCAESVADVEPVVEATSANGVDAQIVDAHQRLIERIQDLHKKYCRYVDYGHRQEVEEADRCCMINLNDIDTGLDLMSSKMKMLSKEVVELKKKNDELRDKNYKIMDVMTESEKRHVTLIRDLKASCEKEIESNMAVIVDVLSSFGLRNVNWSNISGAMIHLRTRLTEEKEMFESANCDLRGKLERCFDLMAKAVTVYSKVEDALRSCRA